jgi:general secretion pathway protein A
MILNEFGLNANGDKSKNLDTLNQHLIDRYAARKQVLLVIDEAQNLSNEGIEEVRMFSNLQADDRLLMQILLVGQPELKHRLQAPGLSQFAQRVAVSFHLEPLQRDETAAYIAYRLNKAGGDPSIFTESAVDLIFQASGGIPRTINLLCDAALVYGYADELHEIDAALIETIVRDKGGIGLAIPCEYKTPEYYEMAARSTHNELAARIRDIEGTLIRLENRLEFQIKELENRANGFKEEMQRLMNHLLQVERKRTDILLLKYSQLKKQHEALLKSSGLEKEANPPDGNEGDLPHGDNDTSE